MDQIMEVELKLAYYIELERIGNEQYEKIIWNEKQNSMIDTLLKSDDKLEVIGLFGTIETVSEYLHQRLRIQIAMDEDVKSHLDKGIICYTKYQKDFFISFIGTDEYFKDEFNDESAKITLYRYLKDLCQKIIMLPSKFIIENWQSNGCHHYQEQETVLQEFQIQKLNERSIEIQKIMFELKKDYQILNSEFFYGQDNLKVGLQKIVTNDYQEFNQETIKQVFLQILNNKHFEMNNYDWENYNQITLQIIKHRMNECRNEINALIDQLEKQCRYEIKGWSINFFRSNLKKNDDIFNIIHTQTFDYLRKNLDIYEIRPINYSSVQNLIIEITKTQQFKQYIQILNENYNELNSIFKEYQKRFQQLYYGKFRIQDFYKTLNQDIQLDISQNNFNQYIEYRIQFNIYEFKIINTNNQQIATMDITNQDLQLCQLKNIIYPEKLSIYYIFQTSNQQQTILILHNQNQNQQEYILVDIKNNKMTEIMRINGHKGFLFYYNTMKTTLYVFNTKIGISILQYNETRKSIQSEKSIQYKSDNDFIDVCYLQYYETFILLAQNNQLYKWQIDKRDFCSVSIQFNQQINNRKINKILSAGNVNYYCLIDQQTIHFINQNNQVVKDIQLRELINSGSNQKLDISNIQLFSDESDWYLLQLQNQSQTTIQIKNLSNLQKIVSKKQNNTQKEKTNPFLDLIKGASIKYGPCNNVFKTTPTKTQLYIQECDHEKIQSYFDLLDLDFCEELIKFDANQSIQGFPIVGKDFIYQLLSRQTVQLCTISNQILKPLSKGILQEEYQKNKLNQIRILDKVNNLSFGVLENLLFEEDDNNIFIVSIMGRQSSGKSYLLNRIFGTRFGVSSARCTDGIWMSISKIENVTFVLLDCEGLFSTRRTQDEETMLLAFLSSISDITILNQDLTFSRNLNELFQNLSKSIEQIRGDKLFKGKLMIAVRDVNQKEKDSAQKELIKNIDLVKNKQQTRNFLTLLFNDQFQTILMSYFDNKQFDKDILLLRREFLQGAKNIKRWDNTQQLIRAMKIMLIQIELKDHRSLEDHESEFIFKNINQKITDAWIYINQEPIPNLNLIESQIAFEMLQQYYLLQTNQDDSTLYHNERLKEIEVHIQNFLIQRMCTILKQLDQDIKQHKLSKDNRVEQFRSEIKQTIQSSISQYLFCNEKCSKCYLQCGLRKDHLEKDQIVQKNNFQEIITSLFNKINEVQGQIPKDFNLESTQAILPSIKTKSQEILNQIEYENLELDFQNQTESLKCLLEIENDYQIDNFENYLKNYLQSKVNCLEQINVLFNYQQSQQQLSKLIDEVDLQKSENDKYLDTLSQQSIQIHTQINQLNETCSQVEIDKNQSLINDEIKKGQQNEVILQQLIQENLENTNNLNSYIQQHQQIINKLQNQDTKQLYQQYLAYQDQCVQNLKTLQIEIGFKLDKIRNDIRIQTIDNYLEREIEQQEELIQKTQSSYLFKKQKLQQRLQKQQEIQYRLSDHNISDEDQNKLKILNESNQNDINLFTQQLNELENQKKYQDMILSQLQEIYQQCSMVQFNQNQDILINQVSDQILKIQSQDQLSQSESTQIELANIQTIIQEIQIYEQFLKQQYLCTTNICRTYKNQ